MTDFPDAVTNYPVASSGDTKAAASAAEHWPADASPHTNPNPDTNPNGDARPYAHAYAHASGTAGSGGRNDGRGA